MARKRRQWNTRYFDHIVMRGNNRQDIFRTQADFDEFFRVLNYANMKHPFRLIAYCVMTNHYHLLLQSPNAPLGKVMGLINHRYTDYYKKKYNYSGYLYDSRYFAKQADSPATLLKISRYIHRNPIKTVVPMVSRMEDYYYSSFHFYKGEKATCYVFLDLIILPSLLPSSYTKSNKDYYRYCEEELDEDGNIATTRILKSGDFIAK
ncbi:transposase [Sporosarcina oncorhynchi]|uniref:Transposase n=1 Tax=Sporosarcina oncorhynchi TaxID=3056444 RepID=A0ABZ0L955_9BACL|nr:transposase [Sporosarcina sp. T2O-4]WOV88061.1 transposase [Sporosarcina sp. T2O-4]